MTGLFIPIALALGGLFAAFATYRGIRRGGARFYTLEREQILRQATMTLALSTLLFLASIGFFIMQNREPAPETPESGELVVEGEGTGTPAPPAASTPDAGEILQFPPTPSPTATIDTSFPTPTATAVLCRAAVDGTSGNGLTLRDAPGGGEVDILAEGSLVQLITEEEAQTVNELVWRKVRSVVTGNEGWVAETFLALGPGCE